MNSRDPSTVLSIEDLYVEFKSYDGIAKVINGVNLKVNRGDILGVVGESGCGKSTLALAATGLLSSQGNVSVRGDVKITGQELSNLSMKQLSKLRAEKIGIIFQDPNTYLNPLLSVNRQLVDSILCRQGAGSVGHLTWWGRIRPGSRKARREANQRAVQLLERTGIVDAETRINSYPMEFSGGMKQRVLTAMALGGSPQLLVGDEPTTGLDASVQMQVLREIKMLVADMGLSVMWITHSLGVVAALCNRVAVMYAGNIVEEGSVSDVFNHPKHPYTVALFESTPTSTRKEGELLSIPGTVPSLINPPNGCRFNTRCTKVMEKCFHNPGPDITPVSSQHMVACHLFSPN